jgi:hypothetical protein
MLNHLRVVLATIPVFFSANMAAADDKMSPEAKSVSHLSSSRHRCSQFGNQHSCENARGCTWAYEVNICVPARPGYRDAS